MDCRPWMGALVVALVLASAWGCGEKEKPGWSGGSGPGGSHTGGQGTGGSHTGGQGTGGTASGGADGGAENLQERYCNGEIAYAERCGEDPLTLAQCLAADLTQCFFDVVRSELLAEAIACLRERDCGEGYDDCLHSVGAASPTDGQAEYLAACSDKYTACGGGFMDDYCLMSYVTTAMYASLTTCIELDCAQVRDCLEAAMPDSCD